MGNTNNTAAQTNDTQATKTRRSPEELVRFHREKARKNEERVAGELDYRVKIASTITRKLVFLGSVVEGKNAEDVNAAIAAIERVHKALVDAAVAEHMPGNDSDPDFQIKGDDVADGAE